MTNTTDKYITIPAEGLTRRERRAMSGKRVRNPDYIPGEIEFDETVVAIPTLGGVITPLPLTADSESRFPPQVRLPVSRRAAELRTGWVVVDYQGRGVAVLQSEAEERGLVEAPDWIPSLDGIPTVPEPGEIENHLK